MTLVSQAPEAQKKKRNLRMEQQQQTNEKKKKEEKEKIEHKQTTPVSWETGLFRHTDVIWSKD